MSAMRAAARAVLAASDIAEGSIWGGSDLFEASSSARVMGPGGSNEG